VLLGNLFDFDTLWLAEALAHSAEDTVAAVLRSRGDSAAATEMTEQNYLRAASFLRAPDRTSLVPIDGFGTLDERGAGWLFLKYLRARSGGEVLGRLTRGKQLGSQNVTAVTGLDWPALVRDWATALYAAASSELNGHIRAEHNFGGFDLGAAIKSVSKGTYPLAPKQPTTGAFTLDVMLPASAAAYVLLEVGASESISLTLRGERGRPFHESARPGIAILRLQ
jgi:hypothetical protein